MSAAPTPAAVARVVAAQVLVRVLAEGRYLDTALDEARRQHGNVDPASFALIQEMAYGSLRWYHQLLGIARLFATRPFKQKDQDIHALLITGLYQLRHMRVPEYAAVDATVQAADALKKSWAKGVLNACLRGYLRDATRVEETIASSEELRYSHPRWFIDIIRRDYPTDWESVLNANNARAPLTLRVNAQHTDRARYLAALQTAGLSGSMHGTVASAIVLDKAVPVDRLPEFVSGHVSVQDAAAQLAAVFLDAQPNDRVLDACAAPGGKAAHILERTPEVKELTALDVDNERMERVRASLARLNLTAKLAVADAAETATWWNGEPYDRILLDVPCSATGVIRRHPDIKTRRQPADIAKLQSTQRRLLDGVWPCLKRGGKLLYATCSVLREENNQQIAAFLARHGDATAEPLAGSQSAGLGLQILPGENDMDGFYYACLRKR